MTMQDRYIIVVKTMLGQGMPMTLKLIGACLLFSLLIGIVFGTIRSLKIPVVDQILGLYAVRYAGTWHAVLDLRAVHLFGGGCVYDGDRQGRIPVGG